MFQRAGMRKGGRVATPTSFSIFDSFDMKSLASFEMARPKVGMPVVWLFYEMNFKTSKLKALHFQASEDILTKFKSQALQIIRIKY